MEEIPIMEAIPTIENPQRYVSSEFLNSPFVELKSNEFFVVDMKYPSLKMKNAVEQCFVRWEVYEMLLKAAQSLSGKYKIKIWDAWRPFALQKELYDLYSANIVKRFGLANCTETQRKSVIAKFVSDPIEDRDVPPVHTSGGAVDVTLVDLEGKEIKMGTDFDAFTELTATTYFEQNKELDKVVRNNRRLLYYTMINAGFTNLPSEWWHFDYGDQFWGYYNRKPAIYKGIFTKEEINGDRKERSV